MGHRRDVEATWRQGNLQASLAGRLRSPATLGQLMHLWSDVGPKALRDVRGDFILVVQDGDGVYLVRDGAGVRSMYWAVINGELAWACEPKGVSSQAAFRARILPSGVARYLAYSFQPGAETLLEGLYEVRPGHYVVWAPGASPVEHRWFAFEAGVDDPEDDPAAWVKRFRNDFSESVSQRLPSGNDPIGVFLSGGIDSAVVTAELCRMVDRPVHSYTIHFGDEYENELGFARQVADMYGTIHHEVEVRPAQFIARMEEVAFHLDDPIGDPITVPNYELARYATRDVDVIFNGEGGDPCFGGPKNLTMLLNQWYAGAHAPGQRERWYLESYRRALPELDHVLTPEWRSQIESARDLESVLTPFFETNEPNTFLEKLLAINIRLKGGHLILPKVDRMLAAHGLRPLSPLFDERMLKLAMSLPATLKVAHGVEKKVLKEAYAGLLPEEILQRPKSGMRVPVHWWLRNEMKGYARSVLLSKQCIKAGIFRPHRIKELLDYAAVEDGGRYGLRLWMLTTFELWRRRLGS